MKKYMISLLLLLLVTITLTFSEFPLSATSGWTNAFNAMYGKAVSSKFSCELCHLPNLNGLNPYGEDLVDGKGETECGDYYPPSSHNLLLSTKDCEGYHIAGYQTPLASSCVGCHGVKLAGGVGPSCYACHGQIWSEEGGGGGCPNFNTPSSHTVLLTTGECEAGHAPGYTLPYDNSCNGCHGSTLEGAGGPSCFTCHGKLWSDDGGGGGGCPEFNTPSSHTVILTAGECEAGHASGYTLPYDNSCNGCHGSTLEGAGGPSCYTCHGKLWSDDGGGGGGCPEFNTPSSHTVILTAEDCDAGHATGYSLPYDNGCNGCHGSTLEGAGGPSCYTCHGKLWNDDGGGGGYSCPDFTPPKDHKKWRRSEDCSARHKIGEKDPFNNNCSTCHGTTLKGGSGPSCYLCHGEEWNSNVVAAAPVNDSSSCAPANDSFKKIENFDSDGDGYSNIEEIKALTNPGDPDSSPSGGMSITVSTKSKWKREWFIEKGRINFRIRCDDSSKIDLNSAIIIRTEHGKLITTNAKAISSKLVHVSFPKALLFTLIGDLNSKSITVAIEGMTMSGGNFAKSFKIKISGTRLFLADELAIKVFPKKFKEGEPIQFEIYGPDADQINVNKPIRVTGPYNQERMENVRLVKGAVTGSISESDARRLFWDAEPGYKFTVAVSGYTTQTGIYFAVPATIRIPGESGGGGGEDDCYEFNHPGSHTLEREQGKCTYYHAPGLSAPLDNGCNMCHGANLDGSAMAPSCTKCHVKYW